MVGRGWRRSRGISICTGAEAWSANMRLEGVPTRRVLTGFWAVVTTCPRATTNNNPKKASMPCRHMQRRRRSDYMLGPSFFFFFLPFSRYYFQFPTEEKKKKRKGNKVFWSRRENGQTGSTEAPPRKEALIICPRCGLAAVSFFFFFGVSPPLGAARPATPRAKPALANYTGLFSET